MNEKRRGGARAGDGRKGLVHDMMMMIISMPSALSFSGRAGGGGRRGGRTR
jgi:hypothetical protein